MKFSKLLVSVLIAAFTATTASVVWAGEDAKAEKPAKAEKGKKGDKKSDKGDPKKDDRK